jgi:phosphohistidine phosphatase
MKKLYVIRHAKSSWDDVLLSDFDRPLNERGEKDAPRMAKRLKEKSVFPDVVLSSTANRALSTCLVFCSKLDFSKEKIQKEKKLYHASENQIFEILRNIKDLNDDEEVVLVFGHNPGLTEFCNSLLNEDIHNVPTCGIVACTLQINSWKEIKTGCGHLDFIDYPKRKSD